MNWIRIKHLIIFNFGLKGSFQWALRQMKKHKTVKLYDCLYQFDRNGRLMIKTPITHIWERVVNIGDWNLTATDWEAAFTLIPDCPNIPPPPPKNKRY
jgi:hypothetical protein